MSEPALPRHDWVWAQLSADPSGYLYLLLSTVVVFAAMGYWSGVQQDSIELLQFRKDLLGRYIVQDLREPLCAIQSDAELLLSRRRPEEPCAHTARGVVRGVHALDRMLANLADLHRDEAGQLVASFRPVELTAVVDEIVESERALYGASVWFEVEVSPEVAWISADPDLFARTLESLVENACRHTGEGRAVQVQARALGGELVIAISHEGARIPPEARPHLFDRDRQTWRTRRGTLIAAPALGLTFCHAAICAHGGSIEVQDRPVRGMSFVVRMPLRPAAENTKPRPAA